MWRKLWPFSVHKTRFLPTTPMASSTGKSRLEMNQRVLACTHTADMLEFTQICIAEVLLQSQGVQLYVFVIISS